jgi:hypothetical protein
MKEGIGVFIWKISVALYLIANGVLGLGKGGDFRIIFGNIFKGDALNLFVIAAGIIALIAGICILLEMFGIEIPFLNTLILIIAIIWAVFIVIEIISWFTGKRFGGNNFFHVLQLLAIHLIVLSSLLIASKKFE